MNGWPWSVLHCPATADALAIKRAYAKQLKTTRPDDDPEGYQQLRQAYEVALERAHQIAAQAADANERAPDLAQRVDSATADARTAVATEALERVSSGDSAPVATQTAPSELDSPAADATPKARTQGPPRRMPQDTASYPAPVDRSAIEDLPELIARIRTMLAAVDRIEAADLPQWWKRLEPDLALVPLAHRDALSRQMAQFVNERTGFPDWLIERVARSFEWERDFRRSRDIEDLPALRERLAAIRATAREQERANWRLGHIDRALATGRPYLAFLIAMLFAPRLNEQFDSIEDLRWGMRFGARRSRVGEVLERVRLAHLGLAVVVLLFATQIGGPGSAASMPKAAPFLVFVGVSLLAWAYMLFDLTVPSLPKRVADAWRVRFSVGGIAALAALFLGWMLPDQRAVVASLVVASLWFTHTGARWRPLWLPLVFAPCLAGSALGIEVPAWMIGTPGAMVFFAHWALSWRYQETIGIFGLGLSDLKFGWPTVIFFIIGFKIVVPVLLAVGTLVLPLTAAVQARTFGNHYAVLLLAFATALTVMTASADAVFPVWLGCLGFCLIAGLILVRTAAIAAAKLIAWRLQS